jgi:hypothetical protein
MVRSIVCLKNEDLTKFHIHVICSAIDELIGNLFLHYVIIMLVWNGVVPSGWNDMDHPKEYHFSLGRLFPLILRKER